MRLLPGRVVTSSIWRPNTIDVILRNPIYKGELQHYRRHHVEDADGNIRLVKNPPSEVITVKRPDLAIMAEDLWNRVQEGAEGTSQKIRQPTGPTALPAKGAGTVRPLWIDLRKPGVGLRMQRPS